MQATFYNYPNKIHSQSSERNHNSKGLRQSLEGTSHTKQYHHKNFSQA